MIFVLRLPSLKSTWLLQRSVPVCSSSNDFLKSAPGFSTRLLSASQLQSPFQSQLGVLLLSRQPSILVTLPCVDDFQYPRFSSSVQLRFFETLFSSHVCAGTSLASKNPERSGYQTNLTAPRATFQREAKTSFRPSNFLHKTQRHVCNDERHSLQKRHTRQNWKEDTNRPVHVTKSCHTSFPLLFPLTTTLALNCHSTTTVRQRHLMQ